MDEDKVYKQIYDHYKNKGYSDADADNVARKVIEREKKRPPRESVTIIEEKDHD